MRPSVWLTAALLILAPSAASAFCMQPSAPSCVNGYGSFDDQYDFNTCRSEMEDYQSEVTRFSTCKQDEVEEVADDAKSEVESVMREYNDAVSDFNNRAGN